MGSCVQAGGGSFHRGQSAGWAQCVCCGVCYLGWKQGISVPRVRALLLPCKFCISDTVVGARTGWGLLIRCTLLLPLDAWLGLVLQDT